MYFNIFSTLLNNKNAHGLTYVVNCFCMNIFTLLSGALAAVLIIGFFGVDFFTPSEDVETGPIRVGVIAPITGPAAAYGELMRDLMSIATEQINADGGINGRQMLLVVEDGKCSGKDAASAAQKLISIDRVQLILGGFCSVESIAAEPIARKAGVMLVSPGSSAASLTNVSKYFARIYPSDAKQSELIAAEALRSGHVHVAALQEQTEYASGVVQTFTNSMSAGGGAVSKEEFPTAVTDVRSIVTKSLARKPDAVFVVAQTQSAMRLLFSELRAQGYRGQLYLNDVPAGDSALLTEFADYLEGAVTSEFTADPTNQKLQEMLAAYRARYGSDPLNLAYAQTDWDLPFLAADALRAVGNEGTKLASWFRSNVHEWSGASGLISVGENGDPKVGHKLEIVKGGKAFPYTTANVTRPRAP